MSTRCRIGIKNSDGTVDSIYCHNDGYISEVGSILVNHYSDEKQIRALLDLGDLSALGTTPVENPHGWDSSGYDWTEGPDTQCTAYKTRGEDCPQRNSLSVAAYKKLAGTCDSNYIYLFEDGTWKYVSHNTPKFSPVVDNPKYKKDI